MRISDWSSDVCSSDLPVGQAMEVRPKRPESSRTRASRPRRAGPGTRAAGRRVITGGRLRSRPSATPCQREPDPAMKLQFPFMQLPIQFDADALAREVLALDESCWRAAMGELGRAHA